jgi:hypothetical protein
MTPEMKKLLVAPVLGGLFVVFLPFIVWPLLAQALWVHFGPRIKMAFHPRPVAVGVSYFAGDTKDGEPVESGKLDKLADEIDSKRK